MERERERLGSFHPKPYGHTAWRRAPPVPPSSSDSAARQGGATVDKLQVFHYGVVPQRVSSHEAAFSKPMWRHVYSLDLT
ncbi:hypothetical protein INR49_026562 [Caranx melampygus]|nr:hypothetical protein INR49_026562 [Caranx melampygus]